VQELALAKALKPIRMFRSGNSGLSIIEKVSAMKVKIGGRNTSSICASVSDASKAPKALDLFGSDLSASDVEIAAPMPC
jgi:hypothetical protein